MTLPIAVAAARRDVDYRRDIAADREQALHTAIRTAITAGVSVTEIARLSDLSRERIYQIRDGRR